MKSRAILVSILSMGILAAGAAGQTKAKSTSSIRLMSNGSRVIVVPARVSLSGGTLGVRKATETLPGSSSFLVTELAAAKAATVGTVTSSATVVTTSATASGLVSGRTVFLGPTASRTRANLSNSDTVVIAAPTTAAASTTSANPLAATLERQVFTGDLVRDRTVASSGLTLGTVATSATSAGSVTVGPNGFPLVAGGTAVPEAGTNPIGPNGFPQPLTNGPQAGLQPINPNGFPATNVAPLPQTGMTRSGSGPDATTLPSAATTVTTTGVTLPALAAPAPAPAMGTSGASSASSASPQ
jgi:hypothetical protein